MHCPSRTFWGLSRSSCCGLAKPGPPCQGEAVEHGTVTAQTRLTCVALTVAGSLLLMAGVVLALVRAVMGGRGWPLSALAPWLLVASGLVCGGIMIAASRPAGSRLGAGRLQPGSQPGLAQQGLAQQGLAQPPEAFGQTGTTNQA